MVSDANAASICPVGYRVEELRSLGRRSFLRACPGVNAATGIRSYLYSDSGFWVSTADVRYDRPTVETVLGAGIMKVHVRLAGPSRVGHEHEDALSVRAMSCSALIHPSGDAAFERFDGAVEERSVTVACNAEFLSEGYGIDGQLLPPRILHFLEGCEGPMYGIDVPLLLETRRVAEVIFAELSTGTARPLMIESRALELLARFIDQVQGADHGPAPPPLLARDRRLADLARSVLEERFVDPPSLRRLATDVGTHPAKLMRLFKAVHGCTISEFLETIRMERARRLLVQGDLPITQIAYELGYEHPSNFATAFKRRFGSPPSAVRCQPRTQAK